jgi:hypothetical protein
MNERWKETWRARVGALTAGVTAAALCGFVACAPADGPVEVRSELADGPVGSARVISVVHQLRPGALVASVGYADTASVPVVAGDGSAQIDINVLLGKPIRPTSPGDERLWSAARSAGVATLEIARDDRRATRQGRWTRQARLADGRVSSVEVVAEGGAPVSSRVVRVGGEVVLRDESRWKQAGGVWLLEERTLTAFAGGRAVGWMETRVETSALRTASRSEVARRVVASAAGRMVVAVADVVGPAPLFAQSSEVGSGPCAKQQESADDAYSDFLASGALFAVSVMGTPIAMAAAYVNLLRAAHKVDVADARMDACVASA